MQGVMPWLFWTWCYSHRLELACKDAFCSPLFKDITEMLCQLYYLYKKSPKKLHDLAEIVADLKEMFDFRQGGDKPLRSQGSRRIGHKRKALERVVARYGAYIHHLRTLVADKSVSAIDRARLTGYLLKRSQEKLLLGAAFYVDALEPASVLSVSLQRDNMDIVMGLKSILQSTKTLKKLQDKDPSQWATAKKVLAAIDSNGGTYQGAELKRSSLETRVHVKEQVLADVGRLSDHMQQRLQWSDTSLLQSVLVFLDPQCWQAPVHHHSVLSDTSPADSSDEECKDAVLQDLISAMEYIEVSFRVPLMAKGAKTLGLREEIKSMVWYARRHLPIAAVPYQKI